MATRARAGLATRLNNLEPLMTRGTIITVLGVVGMVLNMHFSTGTVEYVVNLVLAAFGLLTAVVSRGKVTPNIKVTSKVENPYAPRRAIYGEDQM